MYIKDNIFEIFYLIRTGVPTFYQWKAKRLDHRGKEGSAKALVINW